jgi:adhesin transport system outer membrane protein
LVIGGILLAGAAVGQAKTLGELLPDLLTSHDRIKAAQSALEVAEHSVRQARAGWFPTVSFTGEGAREEINKPNNNSNPDQYDTVKNTQTLSLTQMLYDFGLQEATAEQAKRARDQAAVSLDDTRQAIILEGVTAYLNTLRAYEKLSYARKSEENFKRQTGIEEAMVERGAGLSQDVLQAKAKLSQASARRITSEGELANAGNRFQAVFGSGVSEQEAKTFVRPPAPFAKLPASLDAAVNEALAGNNQLKLAKLNLDIAEQVIAQTDARFYPSFSLYTDVKRKENDAGTSGVRDENTEGVRVTWVPYAGGGDTAAYKAAKVGLQQAKFTLFDQRRTVEEQVRVAWQNLITFRANAEFLRNQADLQAAFLELARKDRKLGGSTTLLNILIGEVDSINAESDAISAEVDTMLAAYTLLRTTSGLNVGMFK